MEKKELKFRSLRADEIDVRVQQTTDSGCVLLLYKDARCDMNILDETVGAMNWQRTHTRDNANCIVSIYDEEKGMWIAKEDTGTESNTEKEKGLASDSFKRACFNWGIGRELYTAPFIWVNLNPNEVEKSGSRARCKVRGFEVSSICYEDNKIAQLTIVDNNGNKRFEWSLKKTQSNTCGTRAEAKAAAPTAKVNADYAGDVKGQVASAKKFLDMVPASHERYESARMKSVAEFDDLDYLYVYTDLRENGRVNANK